MGLLLNVLMGMLKKVIMFAIVFAVVVTVWNFYKAKRESRTFISQFSNVEGLSKGAPIYSSGIEVGKVIKIFPIGNSNNVAVKGLITKDEFPSPRGAINTRIVTNFQDGGGKAIELLDSIYESELERIGLREDDFLANKKIKKAINGPSMKVVLRIMRDTFQMTKDFALSITAAMNSKESQTYQREAQNAINNTITSLEYGTVKQDVKHGIERLNDKIRDFEEKPNKEAVVERTIKNQALALRNTLESYANLSKTYKE
jgi:hypothetical protein